MFTRQEKRSIMTIKLLELIDFGWGITSVYLELKA